MARGDFVERYVFSSMKKILKILASTPKKFWGFLSVQAKKSSIIRSGLRRYHYWERKGWYEKHYWKNGDITDFYRPNGVEKDDQKHLYLKMRIVLLNIKMDGNILDLWCGNGLLLRMVTKKSPYHLVPFGVDFLGKSIKQAKKLFPECPENFVENNIADFATERKFRYIIVALGYVRHEELGYFLEKCVSLLEKNGKIIVMNSIDTYKSLEKGIPLLQKLVGKTIEIENYGWIYWIVMEKGEFGSFI